MNKAQNHEQCPEFLSHYTQFPVLIDILERKKIVFGNPAGWDDKTDYQILREYAGEGKDIRILCLTEFPKGISDNILHWKIYAPGKSGCRIDFDREVFEKVIKRHGVILKQIDYLSTEELETQPKKWKGKPPFLKRSPYVYENECRALWLGNLRKNCDFELDIPQRTFSKLIKCVRLSPYLPKNLAINLRAFLKKHYKIKSVHSWICENPEWERLVKNSLTSKP